MFKKILTGLMILGGFLIISFIFYHRLYWSELFFDRSTIGAVHGEVQATEWGMENVYQSLLKGNGPFKSINSILYPFGLSIVAGGSGFAFNFLLLRQFFSAHQSLALIVVLNYLLANVGMYLLLRNMGISMIISFLIGLAYGNMTFLTVRIGHPGYSVVYLFPWTLYSWFVFAKTKDIFLKSFFIFLIPLLFVMTLWQNMYYFIILVILYICTIIYLFIYQLKGFFTFVKENIIYFILMFLTGLIFLFPWLIALYKTTLFNESSNISGWNGAIEFSSDLFGFFIPSFHNYFYGSTVIKITQNIPFIANIFENFTYPGIIILLTYACIIFSVKKIPKNIIKKIKPFLFISLVFLVLTLGPFLHIFGNWWVQLENGIRLVIPLPFILLHKIPFLGNIRAPGRLIVGFIFLAYIVSAYLIDYLLKNKSKKLKIFFCIVLFLVFIIDNRPVDDIGVKPYLYPNKIFNYIKKDLEPVTVMEIPFGIRDGLTYFGDFNAVGLTVGQMKHGKTMVGGYSGRIPDSVKQYYQTDPFFGYLGRLMDENIKSNPYIDQADLINWVEPNVEKSTNTVNFLDLKYIIVDEKKLYWNKISSFINDVGYKKTFSVNNYSLYEREPEKKEFLKIDLIMDSNLMLGMGWNTREEKFRWSNRRSSVMFKIINPRDMILNFDASSFYKDQPVTIYVNEKKVNEVFVNTIIKTRQLKINKNYLQSGINTVYFIFNKSYRPFDVIPGSLDKRELSGQFTKIWLIDSK